MYQRTYIGHVSLCIYTEPLITNMLIKVVLPYSVWHRSPLLSHPPGPIKGPQLVFPHLQVRHLARLLGPTVRLHPVQVLGPTVRLQPVQALLGVNQLRIAKEEMIKVNCT